MKSNLHAGRWNLKGKRTKILSCGCCVAENFRHKILDEEHLKEMRAASNDDDGYADDVIAFLDDTGYYDSDEYWREYNREHWSLYIATDGKIGIATDDFTHDTVLWVNGDFANTEEKIAYAQKIAAKLNWSYER